MNSIAYKKGVNSLQRFMTFYVEVMICFFPIYFTDRYFHVLEDRVWFFKTVTAAVLIAVAMTIILIFVCSQKEYHDRYEKIWPAIKQIASLLRDNLCLTDIFITLFFIVMVVSTIFSPWRHEAITGEAGRLQGLSLWAWYLLAYYMVRLFYKPEKWHMDLFIAVGTILALWGIFDYIGIPVMGWAAELKPEQQKMFASSFGNINTYTQALAVYAAAACTQLYHATNTLKRTGKKLYFIAYLVSLTILFTGLITGRSDNAVVCIIAIMCGLALLKCRTLHHIMTYFLIIICFFTSLIVSGVLTMICSTDPASDFSSGLLLRLSEQIIYIFGFMILLGVILKYCLNKRETSVPIIRRGLFSLIGIIGVGCIIFFITNNSVHIISEDNVLSNIFLFDDHWGTNRGYIWRTAFEHYRDYPLWQKFLGTGPETFGILTKTFNYKEMIAVCGQVFDSPHNEAIQYLLTTGVFGFFFYYAAVMSASVFSFIKNDEWSAGFIVFVYTAVSLVSISVPIVEPYLIVFLALAAPKKSKIYHIKTY